MILTFIILIREWFELPQGNESGLIINLEKIVNLNIFTFWSSEKSDIDLKYGYWFLSIGMIDFVKIIKIKIWYFNWKFYKYDSLSVLVSANIEDCFLY